MADFWDWFDNTAKTAKATDIGKTMVAAGYDVAHTGGGCMCWEKTLPQDRFLWICDEGNGLGERTDETYLVGHYGPDGEILGNDDVPNLQAAIDWCAARASPYADVLRVLANNDGACLYWQMPDPVLAKAALDAGVISEDGELLVHPQAKMIEAGAAYTMTKEA